VWNRKTRFVSILTFLLLTGFLTTSFVSYYVAHDSLSTQIAETTLPLTSDNIYSEIQQDLLRPIFISSLMAQDTFVRDWALNGEQDEQAIIRYLKEIQVQYGTVSSFFISEKTRKYYHPTGVLKTVNEIDPQDKWYFRVQKMNKDYEVSVDSDTADRTSLTIFINHRVYDYSGNYIGAIGVGLAVEAVKTLIETYQNRYGRQVYFTDREGQVTLRSAHYQRPENIRKNAGLSQLATQILTSPSSSVEYHQNGKKRYLNSRLVPEFNWYLIVEQEEDLAETRIQNTLMGNLAISLVISLVILFLVNLTISGYQRRLEDMATTDKLTGMANRQVFDMLFNQVYRSSKRRGKELAAIMFDIDYFKQVNDSYGHPTGDVVLKTLSQTVKNQIRESDILFRWGGEEFLILLPECEQEKALELAENIRHAVEQHQVTFAGKTLSVTISLGVAKMLDEDNEEDLINRADKALYKAKEKGRNRVELAN